METTANRIRHIIVVVDPSAGVSQAAVDKASILARRLNASVELLICDIETAHEDDLIRLTPRRRAPNSTEFFDQLDQLAAPLRAVGIKVKGRTIYGKSLHDSLLSYLCNEPADLIVKDTHHHSLAKRTLLRNTDWYLAHRCPVPVLFTKTKKWAAQPTIMAALGAKSASACPPELDRQILHCAAALAGGLKGDLQVIHTYVPVALARARISGAELATELEVEHSYERSQIEAFRERIWRNACASAHRNGNARAPFAGFGHAKSRRRDHHRGLTAWALASYIRWQYGIIRAGIAALRRSRRHASQLVVQIGGSMRYWVELSLPHISEDRNACIAEAAYFIAMNRGFSPGHELEDWLTAENDVDARLIGESCGLLIMASLASHVHRTHRSGWMRAGLLGANDGVLSISGLMLGVAAMRATPSGILAAGIAGIVAGALSMGSGEFVSVSSQADTERADLDIEQKAIQHDTAAEAAELRDIYIGRGLDPELAAQVSQQLMAHDALGAHARDDIGITEALTARPLQAALVSSISFALGGIAPLMTGILFPREGSLVIAVVSLVLSRGARSARGAYRRCADYPRCGTRSCMGRFGNGYHHRGWYAL